MFVTVVAVLCFNGACVDEIVTDSDMSAVTFMSCSVGAQAPVAEWKGAHPIYRNEKWTIARIKCVPGHYGKGV